MKKLLKFLKPYKKKISIIFLLIIFSAILNFFIPLINKRIIDRLQVNIKEVAFLLLIFMILYIADDLCMLIRENIRITIAADFKFTLMDKAYMHINQMKLSAYNKSNNLEMIQKIETDINNIKSIIDGNIFSSILQIFIFVGGLIGLYVIDYRLASIVIVMIPIKYYLMILFSKKNENFMKNYFKAQEDYYEWLGDTCNGMIEIKFFGLFKYKYKEFTKKFESLLNIETRRVRLSNIGTVLDKIFTELMLVVIFVASGVLIWKKEITIGSVFAFLTYVTYISNPIVLLLNIKFFLSGIYPSIDRYYQFIESPEEDFGGIAEVPKTGNIEFKNVYFGYDKENSIIENANFCLEYGKRVAIVGKNGVGKTTILKLILRMYEAQKGEIIYSNKNIGQYNINQYRDNIAIVGQEFYLFNDTIKNNLCLYKKVDEKTLKKVITKTGLCELIEDKGMEYIVGSNGDRLSGGQKQKIALARVLLSDKAIIVFDEATSNFDNDTKRRFLDILLTDLKDKLIFVITHDEYIREIADMVLYVEKEGIQLIKKEKEFEDSCS